ncbi:MAG: NUDIX domain-containing protein [Nanoarchaeota archaeon]|nr:NUDIX domain-containing protein [Nanoarchaeota archaeon]
MITEYNKENGEDVNLSKLISDKMPLESFIETHKGSILLCHDVFIFYNGGVLLLTRDNLPAKENLWPVGGRVQRGMSIEGSLKKKVFEECSLNIKDIKLIGQARTTFSTDPFDHGKGTDTFNLVFFAQGYGELKLDSMHKNPLIINSSSYGEVFRNSLHPYVKDFLELSFKIIDSK